MLALCQVRVPGRKSGSSGSFFIEYAWEIGYFPGMTKAISFKLGRALLVKIDGLTNNRSDFIRQAVEEKVKRASRTGHSAWDALKRTEKLDISIRRAPGTVKRVDL